uniref:N-acetyltransferase domain-containing protein n=1 Tax=Monopterus albus TaxID=43700 RepID=A0A3Q3Q7V4_MONAL
MRLESEPITSTNSKLLSGDELIIDLQPISTSHCQTHVEEVSKISTLDGEGREKLYPNSQQPENIRAVPIHRRPDLLIPCADLVNSEWHRSQGARVHSLQKSCPDFPISLVLLQGHRKAESLLGHARLSRVVGHGTSLFVESVVVPKAERGKGYGRILMKETEHYAKSQGFKRLCLTTHDKQHFYSHLGYVLSTPVQNAGSMTTFVPMEMLLKFSRMPSEEARGPLLPPHPPPPPPPPSILPSPPPPVKELVVQTLTETPYRDARGVPIYWMHKDI